MTYLLSVGVAAQARAVAVSVSIIVGSLLAGMAGMAEENDEINLDNRDVKSLPPMICSIQ